MANYITIKLRKLLNELNINYQIHHLYTSWYVGSKLYYAVDNFDGTLTVSNLTPEQAIAATLGGEECEIVYHYEARNRSEIGREPVELSCGHIVERHSKYCQECGRKIRKAVKR